MSTLPDFGMGVFDCRGVIGIRGEVWVQRTAGQGAMELVGAPSGGVSTEEDTEEGPELVSALRTSTMGLALDTTGERGVL